MKGAAAIVIPLALLLAACGAVPPTPEASGGATATGPTAPAAASDLADPTPVPGATTGGVQATDVAEARALAERFLAAFVAEQWSAAYGLLQPQSQATWGGSVTAFAANWPHPARDTGGRYEIVDQRNDPAAVADETGGELAGVDLTRSVIFDVAFPNPQKLVPGPTMELLAAPDAAGTWRLWRLR
jgi:hypothetical protein